MSATGLPMNGHVAEHFAPGGLCQCPCDQCTTRGAKFCVCLDCPCEEQAEHAGPVPVFPDDYLVVEFPEPVRIEGPDGSSWSMHGTAAWANSDGDDEPDDECEGAP